MVEKEVMGEQILPGKRASLQVEGGWISVTVRIEAMTQLDLDALQHGKLELSLVRSGSSGILLLKVRYLQRRPGYVEFHLPFHAGLMPTGCRLPARPSKSLHPFCIGIEDGEGRVRGLRILTLFPEICDRFDSLVELQRSEARQCGWSAADHRTDVDEFYRRFPDPETRFRKAAASTEASGNS